MGFGKRLVRVMRIGLGLWGYRNWVMGFWVKIRTMGLWD